MHEPHFVDLETPVNKSKYRKILWFCLWSNLLMFVVQIVFSYISGSLSLLASSIDFIADSINYGISIYVLQSNFLVKAKASILKGCMIILMGLWVVYETYHKGSQSLLPNSIIMAVTSLLAIAVNLACAALLYGSRNKDSNTYSIWICSRNDVFENLLVLSAAGLVNIFGSSTPDIIAAVILVYLSVSSAYKIFVHSYKDLKKHDAGELPKSSL